MHATLDIADARTLAGEVLLPAGEPLTHHPLRNGYTVSVLRTQFATWEAWAWRTLDPQTRLTANPVVMATEQDARGYIDSVAALPAP